MLEKALRAGRAQEQHICARMQLAGCNDPRIALFASLCCSHRCSCLRRSEVRTREVARTGSQGGREGPGEEGGKRATPEDGGCSGMNIAI
jgi:hypothetical protein